MFVRAKEETMKLYENYCDMVYRICFIYFKNSQDAWDATQETFLRLMKSKKVFESEEHVKSWLIVTASNYSKDVLKSFWHRNKVHSENLTEDSVLSEKLSEGQDCFQQNQMDEVLEAVLNLPEKYKTIVYLHYYEEYSIEEIASILHKNASTLRSRLSRAKKLLRNQLNVSGEYRVSDEVKNGGLI